MKFNLTVGFLLISTVVFAQSFEVSSLVETKKMPVIVEGKVMDKVDNNLPLAFATITVKESETIVSTNLNGVFKLKLIPGFYSFEVEFIGYKNAVVNNVDVKANDTRFIEILLNPETISTNLALANKP